MTTRVKRPRRRAERELPRTVQLAWGLRGRSDKGPRPALSLGRIVDAAVALAASEGLAAVAMSRVADRLNVATMSLYRYVRAKDELLALMVDAAFDSPPAAASAGEGWRRGLARWARAHLTVLRRHPWIVRVPLSGPPILPHQVTWFDRGLGCLAHTGLTEGQKLSTLLLVNGFVRNEALLASDLLMAAGKAGASPEEAFSTYGNLLSRVVDRERFPAIVTLLDSGVFDGSHATDDPDEEFTFGLERILDGIAALIPARRR